eukprot:Nk52_evm32s156 gene=Nk52_evmTU32s156
MRSNGGILMSSDSLFSLECGVNAEQQQQHGGLTEANVNSVSPGHGSAGIGSGEQMLDKLGIEQYGKYEGKSDSAVAVSISDVNGGKCGEVNESTHITLNDNSLFGSEISEEGTDIDFDRLSVREKVALRRRKVAYYRSGAGGSDNECYRRRSESHSADLAERSDSRLVRPHSSASDMCLNLSEYSVDKANLLDPNYQRTARSTHSGSSTSSSKSQRRMPSRAVLNIQVPIKSVTNYTTSPRSVDAEANCQGSEYTTTSNNYHNRRPMSYHPKGMNSFSEVVKYVSNSRFSSDGESSEEYEDSDAE